MKLTRVILLALIVLIVSGKNTFAQSIQELEHDLSWFYSGEKYGNKIHVARKLLEIDPFNFAACRYICQYYKDREIDSTSIFLDSRIQMYPDTIISYLLRSELVMYEYKFSNKKAIATDRKKYLSKAITLDSLNGEATYNLAEIFYQDFLPKESISATYSLIYSHEIRSESILGLTKTDQGNISQKRNGRSEFFAHSPDSALFYFYKLWEIEENQRNTIYYPIRQLESYLGLESSHVYLQNEPNERNFFPSDYFAELPVDWKENYLYNYLLLLESSNSQGTSLSIRLKDLSERNLYSRKPDTSTTVYRFTWLRTFDAPVVVRIERDRNDKVNVYWKEGKGAAGYKPEGLRRKGHRRRSINQWVDFERLLDNARYSELPLHQSVSMSDGASWILESVVDGRYMIHDTNVPSLEFKTACLYLLRLSRIRVKEENIY